MAVQGTAGRALGVLRPRGPFRLDADPHGPLPAEPPPTLTEEGRRRAVRRFRTFAGIFLECYWKLSLKKNRPTVARNEVRWVRYGRR